MEELKRLRQQYIENQAKILQSEIEADIALVIKAKEGISKEKCKAAAKEYFIRHGAFPTIGQCSAYVNVSASKVDTLRKAKSVVAHLKNQNVQYFQGREESDFYFVHLDAKDLFKD